MLLKLNSKEKEWLKKALKEIAKKDLLAVKRNKSLRFEGTKKGNIFVEYCSETKSFIFYIQKDGTRTNSLKTREAIDFLSNHYTVK